MTESDLSLRPRPGETAEDVIARVTESLQLEEVTALRCLECSHTIDDADWDGSPLYECSSCGNIFDRSLSPDGESNRCPQCNKFGGKLADYACDECHTGEMEKVDAVIHEGDLYVIGDGDEPVEEKVTRAIAEREESERRTREREQAELDAKSRRLGVWEQGDDVKAGDIAVGDIIMLRWPVVELKTSRQVVVDGEPQWEFDVVGVKGVQHFDPNHGDLIQLVLEGEVRFWGRGMAYNSQVDEPLKKITVEQAEACGFPAWRITG